MEKKTNKKQIILYVLEILIKYSDEQHLLRREDIISILKDEYNIESERKSISTYIDLLIDAGYDIVKMKNGVALYSRKFEPSEITLLIDSIYTSKSINDKTVKKLIPKLTNDLSIYHKKDFANVYKSNESINRTSNADVLYNVETINEAISNNKRISFQYKNVIKKYPYKVSPYYLVVNNSRYYLICNYDYFNQLSSYRVDLIKDIKILDDVRSELNKIPGYENGFKIEEYINEHIYPFSGKPISVRLKILNEKALDAVYDWFGINVKVLKIDDITYVDLKVDEYSIIYWCLQYSSEVELISPLDVRDKIKDKIKEMMVNYNIE